VWISWKNKGLNTINMHGATTKITRYTVPGPSDYSSHGHHKQFRTITHRKNFRIYWRTGAVLSSAATNCPTFQHGTKLPQTTLTRRSPDTVKRPVTGQEPKPILPVSHTQKYPSPPIQVNIIKHLPPCYMLNLWWPTSRISLHSEHQETHINRNYH